MYQNFYKGFQYNSCVSKGICSISPRISALQTVLVLYLRLFAKYATKIKKHFNIKQETKNFLLNTISTTIYNPDFNDQSFLFAVERFKEELPILIKEYEKSNDNENLEIEKTKAYELFNISKNLNDVIKFGEKMFNRGQEQIPNEIKDLYNIILVISKSISISLLDLESFDENYEEAFQTVLRLLSQIDLEIKDMDTLKQEIIITSEVDNKVLQLLRETQEKHYGIQNKTEVSYSTTPAKAVLAVGTNIKELENIVEALKDEEIDIYTHDDMIIAHTFPKFSNYPRLKGQFGQGVENCLLDFATFPGPIILTKHSLHNIENFYRGLLFTTDYATSPKGVIKIENNDFKKVIESALESRGFKTGKQCESVEIGYNYQEECSNIKKMLETNLYEQIFIIGIDNYSLEQRTYFEKLVKFTPKNVLIISFSYDFAQENVIFINSCFDSYSLTRFFDFVQNFEKKITIFIPKCERNSVPQMIYLSQFKNTTIYVGKCTPIILNPSLIKTLQATFGIKSMSSAKKDLEVILENK